MICRACEVTVKDGNNFCLRYGLCDGCMRSKILDEHDQYYGSLYGYRQSQPSNPNTIILVNNQIKAIVPFEYLGVYDLEKKIGDDESAKIREQFYANQS